MTRDDFDDVAGWPAVATPVLPDDPEAIPAGVSRRTREAFLAMERARTNLHPYTAWCSCWRCEAGRYPR